MTPRHRRWAPAVVAAYAALGWTLALQGPARADESWQVVDDFNRPDMWYHGDGWESLSPGYWKIQDGQLRRRLQNVGNRNPITSFPFHWSTGGKRAAPRRRKRLPDLPVGMIWSRRYDLRGNWAVRARFRVHDLKPQGRGETSGFFGICFGGATPYESRNWRARPGARSWMAVWTRDRLFGLFDHVGNGRPLDEKATCKTGPVGAGDIVELEVRVDGDEAGAATVTCTFRHGDDVKTVRRSGVDRKRFTDGLIGLAAYGALDFGVEQVEILPRSNGRLNVRLNELHVAYALGDTLRREGGKWRCTFVALFRNPGQRAAIRIADRPDPRGGWAGVPIAGEAPIADDWWRRYVAVIDVALPGDPSEQTFYYTVWKDGKDVTGDPRPAPRDAGYLGPKHYVGRLPRLAPPYRVCTLGGHALVGGGTTLEDARPYEKNWIHGQPTRGAYEHFEAYDFQIINWDDDVWYMELLFPPPSTDDAWKIVTLTLANPTTRWQMMRHWNIINPGDHDYGMDDIKGPEQRLVRVDPDLGQDPVYLHRNYSICHLLAQGRTTPITKENPKDWRRWRMPRGDFCIAVLESRLWRTSQDTNLWQGRGWDKPGIYDRTDPTRTLLGEEQFAWLQDVVSTETAPWILISGVNCMHPVFGGFLKDPRTGKRFFQDDRVAADYAGWCKAGVDRLLALLGRRPGILSVYGDIHLACVVENKQHRIIESSCGPIGRGGSRPLKEDWAPDMTDYDGRPVRIHALYHARYASPDLKPRRGPPHWNFLELVFDPRGPQPVLELAIRNIIDPPDAPPRGGPRLVRHLKSTGRPPSSSLAHVRTLPHADVWIRHRDGRPILGTKSGEDGRLLQSGLPDIPPGTPVLISATDDHRTACHQTVTAPVRSAGADAARPPATRRAGQDER